MSYQDFDGWLHLVRLVTDPLALACEFWLGLHWRELRRRS